METPNAEGIGAGFPYCVFLYLNQPCRAEKAYFRYKETQVQAFEAD
jgi:hypothetical protein